MVIRPAHCAMRLARASARPAVALAGLVAERQPCAYGTVSELGALAEELLALAIATRSTEALLLRAQAGLLAWLSEGYRFERCGFGSLNDLAVDALGIRPRTVRERLSLHRIFERRPEMERAFLDGKVTACQVLAVAPLLAEEDREGGRRSGHSINWAEATARLSVREIRQQVRQMRERRALEDAAPRLEHPPEEPEGHTISFKAPVGFQVVFDEAIELSRMVLGRDAPIYECVEAMLQESHWLGIEPRGEAARVEPERRTISVRPRDIVPHRAEAIAHARETLEEVRTYMEDVRDLMESGEPKSPQDALLRLRQVHLLRAPQRVLFARLLRDLRSTQAMDLLGYRSMAELVEDRLRLSERSARNRVAESILFESDEGIARAYATGEISIMQALLIRRLGSSAARRPFVERARDVTWRQFQREYRLLELMKKCDLGRVAGKPFPRARVEEALIEALGGEREEIEEELRQRGIAPPPAGHLGRSCGEPSPHGAARGAGGHAGEAAVG